MTEKQHALHGRDHSPIGMDPQHVGRWHYVGDTDEPPFLNSWGNMAATVDVPDPVPLRFRFNSGIPNRVDPADADAVAEYRDHEIEIQGDIDGGAEDTTVFVLPAEFRLAYDVPLPGHDVEGTYVGSRVLADGSFIRGHAIGGTDGADGADGAPGVGVPVGGSTGNMLVKQSGTDYDTAWSAVHDIPSGGTTGQSLTKQSNTNYDTVWATITGGGSGWHDGSGVPSSGLGANGDYYLDDDTGDIYTKSGGSWSKVMPGSRVGNRLIVIQGNGSVITTGVKLDLAFDFACTIVGWTLLADLSGSIQIDLWKDVYGSYPPNVADTITASAKPLISSALKAQDTTLTGWTTSISAGDVIRVNVDSCTTITRATLALKLKRS